MMHRRRWWNRVWCWTMFYLLTLAVCLVGTLLLPMGRTVLHWQAAAVGVWLAVCLGSLRLPRSVWDRWIPKRRRHPWKL